MRKIVTILLIILVSSCIETKRPESVNNQNKTEEITPNPYDFDQSKVGLKTATDVANGVVDFLKYGDTTKYLSLAIPLNAQQFLFEQNFEFRPDIQDTAAYMDSLDARFEKRTKNFLVRAQYIQQIMIEDKKFDINMARVDSVIVEAKRIKDYGGFDRPIVGNWAQVTLIMNYNNETFYLEIPQIIELKGTWFLYYPEYYIRTQKDKDFINKYLEERNQKANDFLK